MKLTTNDVLNLAQVVWYTAQTAQILNKLLPAKESEERDIRKEYPEFFPPPGSEGK